MYICKRHLIKNMDGVIIKNMKKKYILVGIIMSSINLLSCDSSELEVIYENKFPEILINDIQTEMPGNMFVTNELIIIENPLSGDEFYCAYSKKERKLVGEFCRRGRSGIEFLQPNILIQDTVATIYDLNGRKYVKYSLSDFEIIEQYNLST